MGDDKPKASKSLGKVLFIGSKCVCMCACACTLRCDLLCYVVGEYKSNQMVCSAKA